jgi:hypothetical protein
VNTSDSNVRNNLVFTIPVKKVCHLKCSLEGAVIGFLLLTGGAQAQTLFVASSGGIYEFTPADVESTFVANIGYPDSIAFNSAGDLFEADGGSGNIYEFMPGGVQSTFASVPNPNSLAFDSAGDLFVTAGGDNIYEYTSGGVQSTFASGIDAAVGLAFQGVTLPVPEPSALVLVAAGASAWLSYCRRKFVEQRSK